MKPLHEQVLVITGASSGIGRVTAKEAARRGAKVVLAARNADELERVAGEIGAAGGTCLAVPTDVAHYEQVEALALRANDEFGRIDTWVNNAGVGLYATFRDTSLDDLRKVLEINFLGQVHGAKAALPYLERTGGALVCVGSIASDRGVPFLSAYSASKHALKGWIDALRVELRKEGSPVRVTLVKPTSINTPLFDNAKTQIGVKPQGFPPIYAPELAAEAILYAAQSEARDLYVGDMAKVMSVLESFSPELLDLQHQAMGFELQKTDQPKSADAPNNLYQPLPGGERGSFTAREQTWSLYPVLSEQRLGAVLAIAAGVGLGALALRQTARCKSNDGWLGAGLLGLGALALTAKGGLLATRRA